MKLVSEFDPILKTPSQPFDFENPPVDAGKLIDDMLHCMIENNGLGLSACQIGVPYQVFIFGNPHENESIIPVFNPKLIEVSLDEIYLDEGCLSFPGLYVKIKRPEWIKCRFTNLDGDTDTFHFVGMTARIFQHELDHCNGITFTQRATRYHLEKGRSKRRGNNGAPKKDGS